MFCYNIFYNDEKRFNSKPNILKLTLNYNLRSKSKECMPLSNIEAKLKYRPISAVKK